jgi:hypothetical protein
MANKTVTLVLVAKSDKGWVRLLRRSRAKWLDKLAAEGKEASVESMTTAIDDFLEATRHTRSDQITDESRQRFMRTCAGGGIRIVRSSGEQAAGAC